VWKLENWDLRWRSGILGRERGEETGGQKNPCYSQVTLQDRDIILAVLQSGIALAGLLLIFAGALLTKAATFETRRGDKYKTLAAITLVPVLAAIGLSWVSIYALRGNTWAQYHLLTGLEITLGLTAVFAIIALAANAS